MIAKMSVLCAVTFAALVALDRATAQEINPLMHPVAWIVAGALLGAMIGAVLGGIYKIVFRNT